MKKQNENPQKKTQIIFFLIDKSDNMLGAKIDSVNKALNKIILFYGYLSENDPYTEFEISTLSFSTDVSWMHPEPTAPNLYEWKDIEAGGSSSMGEALSQLESKLHGEPNGFMKYSKDNWPPIIILITGGVPTDNCKIALDRISGNNWFKAATKIAIALGEGEDVDLKVLNEFTGDEDSIINVHSIDELESIILKRSLRLKRLALERGDDEEDGKEERERLRKQSLQLKHGRISLSKGDGISCYKATSPLISYQPYLSSVRKLGARLFCFFRKRKVFASIFSPSEIEFGQHMLIQCFLHYEDYTRHINLLSFEADKKAERRSYMPLSANLKKGDNVHMSLSIKNSHLEIFKDSLDLVWNGSWTRSYFDYVIPMSLISNQLLCCITVSINNTPIAEMRFTTSVVSHSRKAYAKIEVQHYKNVFISYAKEDFQRAKDFASVYKQQNINYFMDRDSLIAGDVFWEKIKEKIDESDLFILFWSSNAAKSESVSKERQHAMSRAYPQIKPEELALIKILPYSIEPRADFPIDMKDIYQFETI